MSVPTITDFQLYTGTPLTSSNWSYNFTKVVNYLTDGNADCTINSVTTNSDVAVGGDLDVTGTLTGDGSGLTKLIMSGNVKIGTFTRDSSIASGTQSVTGVGFRPSMVVFLATNDSHNIFTIGFDNGTLHYAVYYNSSLSLNSTSSGASIYASYASAPPHIYYGSISSLEADGFTINWTKQQSPDGTMTITYLAFR